MLYYDLLLRPNAYQMVNDKSDNYKPYRFYGKTEGEMLERAYEKLTISNNPLIETRILRNSITG